MEEVHRVRVAAVLAADADLEAGSRLASKLDAGPHEGADADCVDRGERIAIEDLLLHRGIELMIAPRRHHQRPTCSDPNAVAPNNRSCAHCESIRSEGREGRSNYDRTGLAAGAVCPECGARKDDFEMVQV